MIKLLTANLSIKKGSLCGLYHGATWNDKHGKIEVVSLANSIIPNNILPSNSQEAAIFYLFDMIEGDVVFFRAVKATLWTSSMSEGHRRIAPFNKCKRTRKKGNRWQFKYWPICHCI